MQALQTTSEPTPIPKFQQIKVAEGKTATLLVADLQNGQKLSIISDSLLKRLVNLLPNTDFDNIKNSLITTISNTGDVEHLCEVLTKELDFHKSVNLINTFFIDQNTVKEPTLPKVIQEKAPFGGAMHG